MMRVFWMCTVGMGLVLSGCTIKEVTVAEETESLSQFWTVDSVITLEANQMQLSEEYWVQRYSVPETNTLFEDWTAIDGTLTTYEYHVDLSANTFTVDIYMNESLEASGEGVFEGEQWDWTYLEYGYQQPDGVSVVTIANLTDSSIVYERVGYGMNGGADWTMDEVMTLVDETEWRDSLPE